MCDKPRHGTEEQVREAFEDFGGQGPRAGSLLRRRSDSPPGGDAERSEPQYRERLQSLAQEGHLGSPNGRHRRGLRRRHTDD